jgi:hypothetical protein
MNQEDQKKIFEKSKELQNSIPKEQNKVIHQMSSQLTELLHPVLQDLLIARRIDKEFGNHILSSAITAIVTTACEDIDESCRILELVKKNLIELDKVICK